MQTAKKEKIKRTVREAYGKIARSEKSGCLPGSDSSCCGTPDFDPETVSAYLGYSAEDLGSVPEGANLGLGCGNPVAMASLIEGEVVVDLGSGGGFDCFLAARQVSETGHVIGVDMTPDMIAKARKNAESLTAANVEFRLGEIEHLPVADGTADIIISNCVINLSPDKDSVYREAFRVLKPGGRLSISDIVTTKTLPEEIQDDLALVSACVGGAATIDDTEKALKGAGFVDIRISDKSIDKEAVRDLTNAGFAETMDYVISATIEAVKPE
jgi:ubiquinone/menaquinone biosynthesis C-methylase UbiE